jgi:hypothetical protein
MKIRNGFVSNSSSSSFIIRAEGNLSTVKDVAKYIMESVENQWNFQYIEERKTIEEFSDLDTPVYFNTGGDETYIRKVDDKIVIETTQNISFDLLRENCLNKDDLTEEFCKKFEYVYIDEDYPIEKGEEPELITLEDTREFQFHDIFDDFNILQHNILGKHNYIRSCPHCKKGFTQGWKLKGGKRICECQVNQIIRKEKLLKINNYENKS